MGKKGAMPEPAKEGGQHVQLGGMVCVSRYLYPCTGRTSPSSVRR